MKNKAPTTKSKSHPNRARKKLPTNSTLSQKTRALLDAFAAFKVSIDEPEPSRSWMIEQGLQLFFERMKEKFPESKAWLEKVETEFQELKQAPVLSLTKNPDVKPENDGNETERDN